MKPSGLLLLRAVLLLSSSLFAASALATNGEPLAAIADAIEEGRHDSAIEQSERLADQGVVHPDLSFNRGLAYLHRARSPGAEAGDYGQAIAGFREALLLQAEDPGAARGLEEARVAVSRRSTRQQGDAPETIGLGHRLLFSLHMGIVGTIAALGSLVLSVGLLLSMAPRLRVSLLWKVMAGVGALLLVPSATLYFLAANERQHLDHAILIRERATLVDAGGKPVHGMAPLIEGTEVLTKESTGGLVQVSLDVGDDYWLKRHELRFIRRRAGEEK